MTRYAAPGGQPPAGLPGQANPRFPDFTDRLMARVAAEPTPTPGRVFVRSTLRLHLGDAVAALATAWHLAFARSGPIPALVRVQSLVVLLAFTVAVGAGGTLAAAGAVRIIENPQQPRQVDRPLVLPPSSPVPNPSPQPAILVSPEPSPSVSPSQIAREPATTDASPKARNGEEARQDAPKAGSGSGDKAQPKSSRQKQKQPARTTPKPATRKQSGSGPPKAGSEAPKAGAGGSDKGESTGSKQEAPAARTPRPGADEGPAEKPKGASAGGA